MKITVHTRSGGKSSILGENAKYCINALFRCKSEVKPIPMCENYSQTSIKAPPLGVSKAGCYTQVAVLSRFSQSNCHVENILNVTRKILSKEGLPVCVS